MRYNTAMTPTLYFLRSSEQKIATDMLYYAFGLDQTDKTLSDTPELDIYHHNYGLNHQDMGLYALGDNGLMGAAWIRLIAKEKAPSAYVDENTPVLIIAVKPEYRSQGVGTMMLNQLLQEAGALYDQISVSVPKDSPAFSFFEKFGFEPLKETTPIILTRQLPKEPIKRPTDGYDPQRWMD